jgi:lincosamide nucleotidyltransferase A/C/D/E
VTAADVREILDRLDAAAVEWWVDGGWGIDALLGAETRAHDDLDLAVARGDLARVQAALPEFRHVADEWWPARFVLRDERGRQIDLHPLVFDERGDGWQELPDGARGRYPRHDLRATGRIGGRDVRCISPELQVRFHDYDDPDDVDWDDLRVLCDRFALAAPPAYAQRPGHIDPKRSAARPRVP